MGPGEGWAKVRAALSGRPAGAVHERVTNRLDVACAAADVLAFVADPSRTPLLTGDPTTFGFVVPGTPAGRVGERQCIVRPREDGAFVGTLQEVVEHVPGRRFVTRSLSGRALTSTFEVETLGPDTCRVRLEELHAVPSASVPLLRDAASRAVRETLTRIAQHTAGGPAPEPAEETREERRERHRIEGLQWAHAQQPLGHFSIQHSVEVAAPPLRVWYAVLDARNDRFTSMDPDATSFTVPGSTPGEVGELRAVVSHLAVDAVRATFQELVVVELGRAVVLRNRSVTHPSSMTTWLEPTPTGTRVTTQVEAESHDVDRDRAGYRLTLDRYLTGVRRVVEQAT